MSGSKRCQAIGACWRVTGCLPRGMAMSRVTVLQWRTRYSELGMTGLDDLARSGRPRRIDHLKIAAATLKPPPKRYGVTHWSSRLMGQHLGIGIKTVATAWREYRVQPWRQETFKFSTDPDLVAKVTDVVGVIDGARTGPSPRGPHPP